MNANDLVSRMLETHQVIFSFGKNGWGLSDEFISVGNRIKELSKNYNIYLTEARIDASDDVYDLVFELHPHIEIHPHEGASVKSNFSLAELLT